MVTPDLANRCQSHHEKIVEHEDDIKKLRHTVYGNGDVGLTERVRQQTVAIRAIAIALPFAPYLGEKLLGKVFAALGFLL